MIVALALILVTTVSGAWDEETVRGIAVAQEKMRSALHAGNVEALADNYADDCRLFSPLKPVCDTREELVKQMQYAIDLGLYDFDVTRDELIGSGDHVIEIGRVVFTNRAGEQYAPVRYMTVWKKDGGRWRIWRDMTTS
ncbi:nuclear transport factor 2 family protein [bacterium]|nr:nuclear transport factor 2 family protein [bacterium]